MKLVEVDINYPVTILNKERYEYYKQKEIKASLTEKEIQSEARKLFEKWASATKFQVDLTIADPHKLMRCSKRETFTARIEDDYHVPSIIYSFENSLNIFLKNAAAEAFEASKETLRRQYSFWMKRFKLYKSLAIIEGIALAIGSCLALAHFFA